MNRQFGCTISADGDQFEITNSRGDTYTFRITRDGDRFLVQNRVDERESNHLYSPEDFTWRTQAIRYSRDDAEAWLRYEYSTEQPHGGR